MIRKALIFYIARNSGHFHAAKAIEKGLLKKAPGIEVEKIDALSYTNPILEKIVNRAYLEVIKKRPEVWGNIYDNKDVLKKTKKARDTLHRFNMSKIRRLLEKSAPDMIFCTQAFPCGMVADYKRSCASSIPLIGVLTDHAPHSYWIYPDVDYYVVPSTETAETMSEKGVPKRKIKVLGIPVDPKLKSNYDASLTRKELGFRQEDPVILIMGGSQGLGAIEEVVKSLLKDSVHRYQLLVVAGSNKKLYSRLSSLLKKKKDISDIKLFGYVDRIEDFMEAADVIVTKAGGMTTAEALVKGLPIIIVNPIPGHERMNADYFVSKGAAVDVEDLSDIHDEINTLFDSGNTLKKMRENIKKISMPDSAIDIANFALSL